MARHAALPKDTTPARGGKERGEAARTLPRAAQQKGHGAKAAAPAGETAADLDRVIHERVRLAIVSALAVNQSLTFNDLKHMLNTTDGNLSVHARKLEEANYVVCNKFFDGRTPKTEYRLTASGRRALERYLSHMEAIIRKTREG